MAVVAMVGSKGGTAKSRLAQALTVELARTGQSVLLADTDRGPHRSTTWAAVREANGIEPRIIVKPVSKLDMLVARLADTVVYDTAGDADKLVADLAAWASLVVVPLGADVTGDCMAAVDLMQQLAAGKVARARIVPVFTKVATDATLDVARAWMVEQGFPPLKAATYFSGAYVHAFNQGKAMTECANHERAAEAQAQIVEIAQTMRRVRAEMEKAQAAPQRSTARTRA